VWIFSLLVIITTRDNTSNEVFSICFQVLCTSSPQGSQLPQEEVWPQQPGKHRFLEPNSSPSGLLHNYLIIFFGFVIKLIVVMELVAMCRVIYPKPWQFHMMLEDI
jgi:hypothetical protein